MSMDHYLREEIVSEFENLKGVEMGTEKYKTSVDGLTKLIDRAIEIEKLDMEHDEKVEARVDEKKDRIVKNILTGASLILPMILTVWGTKKSIEFEKEGTFTTIMGRGFINRLFPKK